MHWREYNKVEKTVFSEYVYRLCFQSLNRHTVTNGILNSLLIEILIIDCLDIFVLLQLTGGFTSIFIYVSCIIIV